MRALQKLYTEIESIFEDARVHRAEKESHSRSGYWQGKKDGLRIAMNLLHQLILEEKERARISEKEEERLDTDV